MLLGDAVKQALDRVGITQERVERWIGKGCNCAARQARLNALHRWAQAVLSGRPVHPMEDVSKHFTDTEGV